MTPVRFELVQFREQIRMELNVTHRKTGAEWRNRADATVWVWLAKECLAWLKAILSHWAVASRDAFIMS